MYNYELFTLLEKVLNKSYQMKNGEQAFYCPFCNHHKKKLQVNLKLKNGIVGFVIKVDIRLVFF